jgi:hypothetical protein
MRVLAVVLACLVLASHAASAQDDALGGFGSLIAFQGGSVAKFVVLSEKAGAEKFKVNRTVTRIVIPKKVERKSVQYSPLAWYLPAYWVPIVASAIGVVLMSLVHQMMGLGQSYVESIISDKKKAKMTLKEGGWRIFGVKLREGGSVLAAAFILGAAISYTYAGPSSDFFWLLGLNMVVCLLASISHEGVHRLAGMALKIRSEYTIWLSGSALTLVTAFLGNAFGLQGFLLEQVEPGTPKWKLAMMKVSAPLFSIAVAVCFAAGNLLYPNVIFQMVYSISGMFAMAEILPFKPMDGYDVRKWNFLVWLVAFIAVAVPYTLMSFMQ